MTVPIGEFTGSDSGSVVVWDGDGATKLFDWVRRVREGTYQPRNVSITLLDEARNPVATFRLRNAQPKKWVGPTLAAKGGGEVAMEELHLVHEGITYE